MPEYLYQNPNTKEIRSVYQSVNDIHEYIDENNIKWDRVYTVPQINVDSVLNPECTEKEFSEFTKNKKGSIGDLWDRSSELSEKRKRIYGEDPVKKNYLKDWKKKRKNKKHPTLEN